jgi:ribosomal protein S18 acetylase RimI-like enzyme
MDYTLRPASADDEGFLYDLFVRTMQPSIVQVWGSWDEDRWNAFFHQHVDPLRSQVVVVEGTDVGVLSVERRPDAIYLDTVEIDPAYQGRGLGTALIQGVLADGAGARLSVSLQVNTANRSRRLYERLGFVITEQTETHYLMRWSPPLPS